MFSFLKNCKNILKTVLNQSPAVILEQFYQHADLKSVQWMSLAVNKKTIKGSLLTKELEFFNNSDAFSLKIAETKNSFVHQLWQNQRIQAKVSVEPESRLNEYYNQLIQQLILFNIQATQEELNVNLGTKEFTPAEQAQDEKALEWIRVSFNVLKKAIIESFTNPELLFQTMLFMGVNPKTGLREIRMITFNLDMVFILLKSGALRIKIYNDKADAFGSSQKAVLEGDFNFRKREMFDELTDLTAILSPGIKI